MGKCTGCGSAMTHAENVNYSCSGACEKLLPKTSFSANQQLPRGQDVRKCVDCAASDKVGHSGVSKCSGPRGRMLLGESFARQQLRVGERERARRDCGGLVQCAGPCNRKLTEDRLTRNQLALPPDSHWREECGRLPGTADRSKLRGGARTSAPRAA